MPDQPAEDLLDAIRRLLAAPTPGEQTAAIEAALDFADQAAQVAWDDAEGLPPLARLLLALEAAQEELERLAVDLAAGAEQGAGGEE
jgi:hypothetical protein